MTNPTSRDGEHINNSVSPVALIVSQLNGTYYTISETSEITSIPVSTLRRWYRTKKTRAPSKQIQVGHMKIYLYTPEDLTELRSHRHPNQEIEDRT